MSLYEILKVLHILGVIAWFGGGVALQQMGRGALKGGDRDLTAFLAQPNRLTVVSFGIAPAVVLIAGVWMVIDSWGFSQLWVILGIAGLLLSGIMGGAVVGRESAAIGEALTSGTDVAALRPRVRRLYNLAAIDLLILTLVVVDMVVKPGL